MDSDRAGLKGIFAKFGGEIRCHIKRMHIFAMSIYAGLQAEWLSVRIEQHLFRKETPGIEET